MGSDQPRPAKDESGDILRIVAELIEAYSADDAERMRATLHSGFVYEEMGTQRETEGRQDFLDIWANWRQVFPDNQGTIEKGFASGGEVVAETTWNGTFKGELVLGGRTVSGTGRQMKDFPVAFVCQAKDGKLARMRAYFDLNTLLRQIGADSPS